MGMLGDLQALIAEGGIVVRTFPDQFNPANEHVVLPSSTQTPEETERMATKKGIRTLIQFDADTVTHISPSVYNSLEFDQIWYAHLQQVNAHLKNLHRSRLLLRQGWVLGALPVTGYTAYAYVQHAAADIQGFVVSTVFSGLTVLFMRFGLPMTVRLLIQRHLKKMLSGKFDPPSLKDGPGSRSQTP